MKTEKHIRSITKAMSWRILATATTMIVAYFITGEVKAAVAIGGLEFIIKLLIYYGHERIWQRINWGFISNESSSLKSIVK